MATKDEWDTVYFGTMAMASVAVGTLGVALGLLALKRSQAEAVGVGSLDTTQHYLFTLPKPVSWLEAYQALSDYGWQPNYIGLIYPGQLYQGRKLLDYGKHQYHVRTYDDGQVTGHYEVTPEWDLQGHLAGDDLRIMTPQESNEVLVALSQIQLVGVGSLETPFYTPLGVDIPKVRYQNGDILVSVRSPGEWHDIRDFINPMDPSVQQVYHQVGPDTMALLDWVCRNITYRSDNGEWWEFPAETISRKYADCEGTSILLASLLRNFTDGYVAIGSYRGYGHAWVELDGQILETTYTSARLVADPQNYRKLVAFNDQAVIELWPGALSRLFQLAHNEHNKLTLMVEAKSGA